MMMVGINWVIVVPTGKVAKIESVVIEPGTSETRPGLFEDLKIKETIVLSEDWTGTGVVSFVF
jgi:hypothetical protein